MSSTVRLVADLHVDHANIITYCGRPFADVDEMNEALFTAWEETVHPGDLVYVLGDVIFTRGRMQDRTADRFAQLPGNIYLIQGNHDRLNQWPTKVLDRLIWTRDLERIRVQTAQHGEVSAVLSHYPMLTWPGKSKGTIQLFGHVHNNLRGVAGSFEVGVDALAAQGLGWGPVDFDTILDRMHYAGWKKSLGKADGDETRMVSSNTLRDIEDLMERGRVEEVHITRPASGGIRVEMIRGNHAAVKRFIDGEIYEGLSPLVEYLRDDDE